MGSISLSSEGSLWSQGVAFLSLYTLATMHSLALLNLKFSTRMYFFKSIFSGLRGRRAGHLWHSFPKSLCFPGFHVPAPRVQSAHLRKAVLSPHTSRDASPVRRMPTQLSVHSSICPPIYAATNPSIHLQVPESFLPTLILQVLSLRMPVWSDIPGMPSLSQSRGGE